VDCVVAKATKGGRIYLVLMNELGAASQVKFTPDATVLTQGRATAWSGAQWFSPAKKSPAPAAADGAWSCTLPPYGLTVLALDFRSAAPSAR